MIATGSEVEPALKAKEILLKEGYDIRVVSMPSMELFDAQSKDYKESVLPSSVRKRAAIEALSDFGWGKYIGLDGITITMKNFGASAPAKILFEKYGFSAENIAERLKEIL